MADFNGDGREKDVVDATIHPAPKRIIICCDGTWQSAVTEKANVPSNVTRIARNLEKAGRASDGKEWQQLVYYDGGIGTAVGTLESKFQGGTGAGFVQNVIEAYNFIVMNYNLGDQVFCFGFSRGAYTARAVAGLVTDIGIIRPRDMQDFPELHELYHKHTASHSFRKSEAWRQWVSGKRRPGIEDENYKWESRPHYPAPESTRWVECVGVFDTVGSLGVPEMGGFQGQLVKFFSHFLPMQEFGFHNVELSPFIKHAYHALALDEHRKPFGPTLWHLPAEGGPTNTIKPKDSVEGLQAAYDKLFNADGTPLEKLQKAWSDLVDAQMYEELKGGESHLLQVWFPGVHINVGGGSDDLVNQGAKGTDFEQIAIVTLNWMVEQVRKHLAFRSNFTDRVNKDRFLLMRPVVEMLIDKDDKKNWLVEKIDTLIAKDPENDPYHDGNKTRAKIIAADALRGWASGPIVDSFRDPFKGAGSAYRTPGFYNTIKDTKDQDGKPLQLGATNEYLHPTVKYRIDALDGAYKPPALEGYSRSLGNDKRSGKPVYQWSKNDVIIPEWKIETIDSYERTCAVSEASRTFLGHLDLKYSIDSQEARDVTAHHAVHHKKGLVKGQTDGRANDVTNGHH